MQQDMREQLAQVKKWRKEQPWLSEEEIYEKLDEMKLEERRKEMRDRIGGWVKEMERWKGEWEEKKCL